MKGGPIQRFLSWLKNVRTSSITSTVPVVGPCPSCSFLPMHLPAPPEFKELRSRRALRAFRVRCSAWSAAELMVSAYNYFELGSPKNPEAYRAGMGPYQVSDHQRLAFIGLVDQLSACCSCSVSEDWTRGRKTLLEAIRGLSEAAPGQPIDPLVCPARAVDPARISLPSEAGRSRPEELLSREYAEVLENYEKIELPMSSWPAAPVGSCHWVSPQDEEVLRSRLLESRMVDVVEASAVPRLHGRPLVAGLFTVAHKPASDRLIVDRRPANATERRLVWAKLPSGSQFGQVRLAPDQCLRGSGEDLQNFF